MPPFYWRPMSQRKHVLSVRGAGWKGVASQQTDKENRLYLSHVFHMRRRTRQPTLRHFRVHHSWISSNAAGKFQP